MTFVIAEAGVNHNGSIELALELVEAAARSGADAVKFQTFSADRLVRPGARTADYQRRETGADDQYEMLKALELSVDAHRAVVERCAMLGIEFMSTAFDLESLDFLLQLGVRRLKVPSGEITNEPMLEVIGGTGLPVILSTGMADLDEVQRAVHVLAESRPRGAAADARSEWLTVLHCTSAYPAAPSEVNLRAMSTVAQATGVPVGYSDHTLGIEVAVAATALGATVIEKHFTIDRDLPGPDHRASLLPDELANMITSIRNVEKALGSVEKRPTPDELAVREVVRRSVTIVRPVASGAVLQAEDLDLLRPGTGIAPAHLKGVIGMRAKSDLSAGHTLAWADIA